MRVDFYLLENQAAAGVYPFACRLLEKIYKTAAKAFVVFNAMHDCEMLNKTLWTFNDISFIPHCLATAAEAAETPIQLGLQSQLNNYALVLNLSNETLINIPGLERIIEIVPNDSEWRQISRVKYSAYKQQDYDLQTHKIL